MAENLGSGSGSTEASNLRPLRFTIVHGGNVEISHADLSTAKLKQSSSEGTALINRPVRVNEKVYIRYVDIRGWKTGFWTPFIYIRFTDPNGSPLTQTVFTNVPNNARNWNAWLKCQDNEKGSILHFYVNEKGEVHYGINGEGKGVIISGVDTGRKLWVVIKLFGGLREVKLVDPETLDAVKCPNQNQAEDGVKHPNQIQVEDGVKRPNQIQVEDGVKRPNQNQVEDGVKHPNQIQVKDGVKRPNQIQVKDVPNYNSRDISRPGTSNTIGTRNQQPLRFQRPYIEDYFNDIEISPDQSTAKLRKLNIGTAFGNRPIRINEKVCLRYVDICERKSGVYDTFMRIGFTRNNSLRLGQSIFNSACGINAGYQGSCLKCYENDRGKLLHFYVNGKGELHYGINGEEKGVLLSKINTGEPLWLVIQLVGGVRNVKLVDPDGDRRPNQNQVKDGVRRPNQNQVENDPLVNKIRSLSVDAQQSTSTYQNLVPLILHRTKSKNIKSIQNDDGVIVGRLESVSSKSYVFSAQPMRSGQTIVVQIIGTEQNNQGSLTIGLTSCDPKTLTPQDLLNSVVSLQDRPEYWVVHPNAASGLRIGDELAMTLTTDGKMEIKNTSPIPVAVFHVDNTIYLWAFINICGTTKTVKLLVSKMGQNKKNTKKKQKKKVSQKNSAMVAKTKDDMPSTSRPALSECTICLEDQVDSVVYKCGHMCMCYNCAVKQWKGEGSASGRCPLCRGVITDVIRTFIP